MLMLLLASLEAEEERAALTAFYRAHNDGLFRYALSLLRNPSLAEEALSAAWVKCLEHRETFFSVPPDKHTALSLHKKEARHGSVEKLTWEPVAPATQDPQHRQGHQDIVRVIRAMPEQYRTVLELKFLREWNSQQIANATGLTVNAVNTRISRGRKLLQEALRKEGYGDV